jgi:hypothetical protein
VFGNPRAYLRDALGDEDETLIESVFQETPAYSERVIGLGLWQPRVVPWVRVATTDWFGPGTTGRTGPPAAAGIRVGDELVELTPAEADDLRERVERAKGSREPTVELSRPEGPLAIPATHETLTALARLEAARRQPVASDPSAPRAGPGGSAADPSE